MQRKILAVCAALVAVGALAFAATGASAATLQDTVGTETKPLAVGAKITAYSTGTSFFTGSGLNVECNENIMTGSVHKNNGEDIQVTIEDAWFQSNLTSEKTHCRSPIGNVTVTIPALTSGGGTSHWCIKTIGVDEWELWGNNCTTSNTSGTLTFILHVGGVECKYDISTAVKGTFTTETNGKHETSKLSLGADTTFPKESGGILCPGTGELHGFAFDLFTDPGTSSNYVDPTKAPNPVWIKSGV